MLFLRQLSVASQPTREPSADGAAQGGGSSLPVTPPCRDPGCPWSTPIPHNPIGNGFDADPSCSEADGAEPGVQCDGHLYIAIVPGPLGHAGIPTALAVGSNPTRNPTAVAGGHLCFTASLARFSPSTCQRSPPTGEQPWVLQPVISRTWLNPFWDYKCRLNRFVQFAFRGPQYSAAARPRRLTAPTSQTAPIEGPSRLPWRNLGGASRCGG